MADPAGRRRRPTALRRRLVLVLVAVLLAFSAALAVVSTLALRSQLVGELDAELLQTSERVAHPPRRDVVPPAGLPDPADLPTPGGSTGGTGGTDGTGSAGSEDDSGQRLLFGVGPDTLVLRYDAGALVVAGYVPAAGGFTALADDQVAALEAVPQDGAPHDVAVPGLGAYRAVSTTTDAGDLSVVAVSTAAVGETVTRYVAIEAVVGVLGVALAALAGTWLVRRSLRPLDDVAAAATRVSELELARGEVDAIPRVPADLTDEGTEVGQVGAALNRMLAHVETSLVARHTSETQVRQFVADASHELRTPLASIRGYAELVRRSPDDVPPDTRRALDRIESESVRMGALVEDLLLLARLDAGRPLDRTPVDLTALAADAVTDAYAASPDHRWGLDLPGLPGGDAPDGALPDDALPDDAPADDGAELPEVPEVPEVLVPGDEARLRQVLANLLSNARTHTPPGTRVDVGLAVDDAADQVVLTVSDDGPGVPAALRPALFQRFSRGDAARTRTGGSTGLGLAIVQAIVHAHHGTIVVRSRTADDRAAGEVGTTVEVRLPRA